MVNYAELVWNLNGMPMDLGSVLAEQETNGKKGRLSAP